MGGPARVLGRSSGVLGLAWGSWEVLGVYLEVLGASSGVLGRSLNVPRGVFGDPWGFLGGPREVTGGPWTSLGGPFESPWGSLGGSSGDPRGSLGGPGRLPKQTMFFQSVSGGSWGALGVVLVLWGGPWVDPGKSKCCYFVDISDVLGKQGFSLIFC